MRVYLVRHGKASRDPQYVRDADRPLTDRGRADVERIARQIALTNEQIEQIRHSGLLRAEQTAAILAEHIRPPAGSTGVQGLLFDDPVDTLARELTMEPAPVMLVGHNPFMERLASQLLTGSPGHVPLWFTTSGVACFEHTNGAWSLRWMLTPKIMPPISD